MKYHSITVVRIYLVESSHLIQKISDYLRQDAAVKGMTVFEAVDGFGMHRETHTSWMDLSLDNPRVIEFIDHDKLAQQAMAHITQWVKPEHMIWWSVHTNKG